MPHKQLTIRGAVTAPARIIGHVGVATPSGSNPVSDAEIIEAVWILRRAINAGPYATVRALQQELAYLRRHARRQLRRAAS